MAYIPIVLPTYLVTNLYQEILDEISRNDSTILTRAIDNGISETKIYLGRYDQVQLFGDPPANGGLDISATFTDPYLTSLVKDVICWHVIKLANPNVNYEHIRTCYEDAIKTLTAIQKGMNNPNWPLLDTTGEASPLSDSVVSYQFPKRNNGY